METVTAAKNQDPEGKWLVPQAGQIHPVGAGLPMTKVKVKIDRKEK